MARECSIEGCVRPAKGRGWCGTHWLRWRKYGDPNIVKTREKNTAPCKADGCDSVVLALGFCMKHYHRMRNTGSLELNKAEVGEPMAFLKSSIANANHHDCLVWPYAKANGYGYVLVNGKPKKVHRVALAFHTGSYIDRKEHVLHGDCHNSLCFNPHHLSYGDRRKNLGEDRIRDGTHNRGERCGTAKLNRHQVRKIRQDPRTPIEIAADYPIKAATVTRIKQRRTWAWLD